MLAAVAVVLGVVAAATGLESLSAWVSVVTTVGHRCLLTSPRLVTTIRSSNSSVPLSRESIAASHRRGQLSDAELVDECERVISV